MSSASVFRNGGAVFHGNFALMSKAGYVDLLANRDEVTRLKGELDAALARAQASERAAHDAIEAARALRSDQFECERLFHVGDVEGDGNVWVRVRSTDDGIRLLLKHIFRLDARAVFAEAALERANERCRHAEKRDWIAGELRRAEFEWQDTIPVEEPGGERVLVRVRGTEGGIAKIKAFIERQEGCRKEFYTAWEEADARADAAELRVSDLEGTVETYARFARAMRQLDVATEAA